MPGRSWSLGLLFQVDAPPRAQPLWRLLQYSLALLTNCACSLVLLVEQVINPAQVNISIPPGSEMGLEELNSDPESPLMHSDEPAWVKTHPGPTNQLRLQSWVTAYDCGCFLWEP